ncbi:MAG: hypothetical protein ACT4OG_03160 [Alphaproteobacteria bacterium]
MTPVLVSSGTRRALLGAVIVAPLFALATPVIASHSWSTYHWKRTTSELTVPVGENVDSAWDSYLATAVADWNQSTVINSPLVPGSTRAKSCRAVAGTIQACSAKYGNTGWLGIATIWLSGGHISQATTKVNDTYFNTATYNTPAWRALVMCQEIAHDYGLDHQDENFNNANLGTCMDYTSNPSGPPSNEHPNAHDYEQLLLIYNHLESSFSARQMPSVSEPGDTPAEWGRPIRFLRDGRPHVFERIEGPGRKVITHVFWALGQGPQRNR